MPAEIRTTKDFFFFLTVSGKKISLTWHWSGIKWKHKDAGKVELISDCSALY